MSAYYNVLNERDSLTCAIEVAPSTRQVSKYHSGENAITYKKVRR